MKCFRHEGIDSIGICMACGRGLCRQCAVADGMWLNCGAECGFLPTTDRTGQLVTRQYVEYQRGAARFIGILMALLGACLVISAILDGPGPGGFVLMLSTGGVLFLLGTAFFFAFGRKRPPVPGEREEAPGGPGAPNQPDPNPQR